MTEQRDQTQPQIVQLSKDNVLQLLYFYVDKAQSNGAFKDFEEAHQLKVSGAVCVEKQTVQGLSFEQALNNLVKAVHKGQEYGKGTFNLNDASNIFQILLFIQQNKDQLHSQELKINSQDLSELSEPVPLNNIVDV